MKKAVACFLCVVICIGVFPVSALAAARDTSFEETLAADLKQLGLFLGVSDTDFDLDREPSRAEAVVMLIRLYGKESEALGKYWSHPFTDVPSWADRYVGYAYQQGWTNGISANKFGMGVAEGYMYLTFVLRALGYSDVNGADFTWNNPYGLARSAGILPDCVNLDNFWRADVVLVSYAALSATLKNSVQTLAQKLIAAGAFSKALFDACYDPDAIADYMGGSGEQFAFDYLKTYLVNWGDYSPEADAYYLSDYILLWYCPADGELSLNFFDSGDGYDVGLFLYLEGGQTTGANRYYFEFYDYYLDVYGDGYIYPSTFDENSTVSFTGYTGLSANRSYDQEFAKAAMLEMVVATQYMFWDYGIGITIADLGFDAVYYEYLS